MKQVKVTPRMLACPHVYPGCINQPARMNQSRFTKQVTPSGLQSQKKKKGLIALISRRCSVSLLSARRHMNCGSAPCSRPINTQCQWAQIAVFSVIGWQIVSKFPQTLPRKRVPNTKSISIAAQLWFVQSVPPVDPNFYGVYGHAVGIQVMSLTSWSPGAAGITIQVAFWRLWRLSCF